MMLINWHQNRKEIQQITSSLQNNLRNPAYVVQEIKRSIPIHDPARMMRFTCVLHENTLYFIKKKVVQIEHFSKKTAFFAVFQCDFDENVATSSERANDAFAVSI